MVGVAESRPEKACKIMHYRVILLLVFTFPNQLLAQAVPGTENVGPASALRESLDSRNQILSYLVSIDIITYSQDEYWGYSNVTETRIEILADQTTESFLAFKRRSAKSSEPTRALLKNEKGYFEKQVPKTLKKLVLGGDLYAAYPEGFFDPLSVGVGYCAELSRFMPYKEILKNWELTMQGWTAKSQRGVVELTPQYFSDGSTEKVTIDLGRGAAWLSNYIKSGKVYIETEPVQINGKWLPRKATIHCNGPIFLMTFDWKLVNEPINPIYFDEAVVAQLLGAELETDAGVVSEFVELMELFSNK